jgi:hypothetical protein
MNNSVIEKINSINTGGISNNMMAYKLSLIMQQAKDKSITPTTNQETPQEHQQELTKLLSKSNHTHNIEEFRRKLKDKYYSEYLTKFESKLNTQPQEQDTSTRIERLIAEKKAQFLPLQQSKLEALFEQPEQQPKQITSTPDIPSTQYTHSPEQDETAKKFLIPAIMGIIVSHGQTADDDKSRIYEGVKYRLQLLIKEGMQFLSINRQDNNPGKAFSAYKDGNNEFRILENNLTTQETQDLLQLHKQKLESSHQPIRENHPHHDNEPELGN